jgi:hypothetical protein
VHFAGGRTGGCIVQTGGVPTMARAMTPDREPHIPEDQVADPRWFREPSRREHWIAAGIFIGFGVFFVLLFLVLLGWWFRWVVLGLGVYSIAHGVKHAFEARRSTAKG